MNVLCQIAPQTLGEAAAGGGPALRFEPVRRCWLVRWTGPGGDWRHAEGSADAPWAEAAHPGGGAPAAADTAAWSARPEGFLAGAEHFGVRAALRSGRRVPGQLPRFPSAALIFCVERNGSWQDAGWVQEDFATEIGGATLAGAEGRWVLAYLARAPAGSWECRIAAVPRSTSPVAAPAWRRLPAYPQAPGRAGAMAGVQGDVLLVAGGANFPDLPPWEGGVKRYYADIYALLPGETEWRAAGQLPAARGYGAVVSTPRGVLLLGGEDAQQVFGDSLFLSWNGRTVVVEPGPPPPAPVTNAAVVVHDGSLYLVGGYDASTPRVSRREFWRRPWPAATAAWERLPAWPGPGRAMAVAAALAGDIYVISGLEAGPGAPPPAGPVYLRDAYRYRPSAGWERLPDLPWSVIAAPSPAPVSANPPRLFVFGGVDGTQVGKLPRETPLPNDILCYEPERKAWTLWPEAWPTPVVTIPATALGSEWVFVSGEIKPGKRTTEVWAWRPPA